jgi:hypothetical protein
LTGLIISEELFSATAEGKEEGSPLRKKMKQGGFTVEKEDETRRVCTSLKDQPHSSPGIRSVYI